MCVRPALLYFPFADQDVNSQRQLLPHRACLSAVVLPTMMAMASNPSGNVSPKEMLPSGSGVLSQIRKVASHDDNGLQF